MTEVATDVARNGDASASARERIAHDLEQEIAQLLRHERQLELELANVKSDRKAFEQSMARLRDGGRGPYKKKDKTGAPRVRPVPSGIGPKRLDVIRQSIFRLSLANDEFRQVDVRAESGNDSSSQMANAFELLRQQGLIRFARKDGLAKCFRLTPEGARERDEAMSSDEAAS